MNNQYGGGVMGWSGGVRGLYRRGTLEPGERWSGADKEPRKGVVLRDAPTTCWRRAGLPSPCKGGCGCVKLQRDSRKEDRGSTDVSSHRKVAW